MNAMVRLRTMALLGFEGDERSEWFSRDSATSLAPEIRLCERIGLSGLVDNFASGAEALDVKRIAVTEDGA